MKYVFTCLLLLGCLLAQAQTSSCDSIIWKANRKLTWADFKGTPAPNDRVSARTRSNFVREWSAKDATLKTTMICFFSPCLSWSRNKTSERLLRHEQGHFDITEYYKRIYYKRIAEANYTPETLPDILKAAYQSITQECGAMQEAYDLETNHSLIAARQTEWEQKITYLLNTVKDFDKEELVVALPVR